MLLNRQPGRETTMLFVASGLIAIMTSIASYTDTEC